MYVMYICILNQFQFSLKLSFGENVTHIWLKMYHQAETMCSHFQTNMMMYIHKQISTYTNEEWNTMLSPVWQWTKNPAILCNTLYIYITGPYCAAAFLVSYKN